jgi:hypothetical protein
MLDAIKGIVGAVAPNLGAALGGPIGGAAMTMLSQALGCENNERALQRAFNPLRQNNWQRSRRQS